MAIAVIASDVIAQGDADRILGFIEKNGLPSEVVLLGPAGPKINLLRIARLAGVSLAGISRHGLAGELQRRLAAVATRSVWSVAGRRFIPTRNRPHGRDTSPGIIIDFRRLKVADGGLLDTLLAAFPVPAPHRQVQLLLRHVSVLTSAAPVLPQGQRRRIRRILGNPVAELHEEEVCALAEALELCLESRGHGARTKREYVGAFFGLVAAAFERSGKVRPRRPARAVKRAAPRHRGLVSDHPDKYASRDDLRPALVNAVSGTPEAVREKAIDHLQDRLLRIETACDLEIRGFLDWRRFLAAAMSSSASSSDERFAESIVGYGASVTEPYRSWLKEERISEVAATMMNVVARAGLYREKDYHELRAKNQAVQIAGAFPRFCQDFPLLRHWVRAGNKSPTLTWIPLSYWYVPRCIQLAIEIKLQIVLSWNRDTCRNLEAEGVDIRTWHVSAVKGKTGKRQYGSIQEAGAVLHEGMKLMLEQDVTLANNWSRECPALFVAPVARQGRFIFGRTTDHKLLARFIRWHELPSFTREQLRSQGAASRYLKEQNPHAIQGLLGHESLATTTNYLQHTVIAVLNRANIASFQKELAASIKWAIDTESVSGEGKADSNELNGKLLFPISDHRSQEEWMAPMCDVWMANRDLPLLVDKIRIQHLMRQRKYYARNWQRLRAENPEGFESLHRPRIEFTAALWRVVSDSPYGRLLEASA